MNDLEKENERLRPLVKEMRPAYEDVVMEKLKLAARLEVREKELIETRDLLNRLHLNVEMLVGWNRFLFDKVDSDAFVHNGANNQW